MTLVGVPLGSRHRELPVGSGDVPRLVGGLVPRLVGGLLAVPLLVGCVGSSSERSADDTRVTVSAPAPSTQVAPTTIDPTLPASPLPPSTTAVPAAVPSTIAPSSTVPSSTVPSSTVPSTTVPSSTVASSAVPSSTVPVPSSSPPGAGPEPLFLPATFEAFARIARGNLAASMTVWRDGQPVFQGAVGADRSGAPLTTASPMVVASVGKLVTALTIARLEQQGALDVGAAVPWDAMGLDVHPAWTTVTVRDLLDHTSGLPVARQSWLDDPGTCADPLAALLTRPPTSDRFRWRYSNGNYCALGLLIEQLTGARYDEAARQLVLEPVGVTGARLTVDGPRPGDGPYARGIARFDRLGAAGSWLASTDDVAAVLAAVTPSDLETLRWPGIFLDQFGWGHTGTVAGARGCAWVLEDGRTTVAVTVAGDRPSVGGGLCDVVLPALAADLGLDQLARVVPDRSPPGPLPGPG